MTQLWNFRVRTTQYPLQNKIQDPFVKNVLHVFKNILSGLDGEVFLGGGMAVH